MGLAAACVYASAALAQTASSSGEPGGGTAIPPPGCNKPEYPGNFATDARRSAFNREYKAYGDCVKAYVESMRKLTEQAQAAANRVVDDYNNYSKALQAQFGGDSAPR